MLFNELELRIAWSVKGARAQAYRPSSRLCGSSPCLAGSGSTPLCVRDCVGALKNAYWVNRHYFMCEVRIVGSVC